MKKKEQTLAYKLKYYDWSSVKGTISNVYAIVSMWLIFVLYAIFWVVVLAPTFTLLSITGMFLGVFAFVFLSTHTFLVLLDWWDSV